MRSLGTMFLPRKDRVGRNGYSFDMITSLRNCLFVVFILGVSLALGGCTAAYNVRTVESPASRYAAECYVRGGFGRSYISENEKLIKISIYKLKPDAKESEEKEIREAAAAGIWKSHPSVTGTNTLLFEKRYRVKGSDVEWEAVWGLKENLSITFYDHGPVARKEGPKRPLKTLNYHFDTNEGIYTEETSQVK
jgi:hypothetical protein